MFASFNVTVTPLLNVTVKLAGRIPSWFSASSHTFLTDASVTAGVCLFVIVVTVPFVVLFSMLYPSGTSVSVHVYLINCPFSYFGNPATVCVHLFPSFNVTSVPLLKVTVKVVGRFPSWLLLSSHTFLTVASVVSGVYEFVNVVI